MKSILIDAGPLIALFDKDDRYHQAVLEFLKEYRGKLVTTWPVLTEVSHMLNFHSQVQRNFLTWVQRGGAEIFSLSSIHLQPMITYMAQYNNVPMDLADSSLVLVAEQLNLKEIATLDSDYYIYRLSQKRPFCNALQSFLK